MIQAAITVLAKKSGPIFEVGECIYIQSSEPFRRWRKDVEQLQSDIDVRECGVHFNLIRARDHLTLLECNVSMNIIYHYDSIASQGTITSGRRASPVKQALKVTVLYQSFDCRCSVNTLQGHLGSLSMGFEDAVSLALASACFSNLC